MPLLPPKVWKKSDGCSGVPDYHYRQDCRRHDWAYRKWGTMFGTPRESRRKADLYLREDMRESNVQWVIEELQAGRPLPALFLEWLLKWSWRPWAWWVVLRLVGWRNYHSKGDG